MQEEVTEDPFSKKLINNMKAEVKRMTSLVSDLSLRLHAQTLIK